MRTLVLATLAAVPALMAAQQPAPDVIDRTLAIVGGQVITLSDARAAEVFGLVDGAGVEGPALAETVTRLVERELVLREVQRYAPAEPDENRITARLAAIRGRFADQAALDRAYAETGFSEGRLRAWIRDDLRTEEYLGQRFATAGTPSDQEIAEAYQRERETFERAGVGFDAAVPVLRDRLAVSRRRDVIADWVSDLRRRTPVTLFVQ